MYKFGYKICYEKDNRLFSAYQHGLLENSNPMYIVEYSQKKWAQPHLKCGPLAVWKEESLIYALTWAKRFYYFRNFRIFRCKYQVHPSCEMWITYDDKDIRWGTEIDEGGDTAGEVLLLDEIQFPWAKELCAEP